MVEVRITHQFPDSTSRSILRNFGEALWRELRYNKKYIISLAEIDAAEDVITFSVRKWTVRETKVLLDNLLNKHVLGALVRVEFLDQ